MNYKQIVHIATDEKFINAAYDVYEKAFPGQNSFMILLNNETQEIKHLSKDKNYEFQYCSNPNWISEILDKINSAGYIVFHGMSLSQANLALSINSSAKLVWTVFGTEVYQNIKFFGKEIYGRKTFNKYLGNKYLLKNKFRPIYYNLIKGKPQGDTIVSKALNKMDYCSILYKDEFDMFIHKGVLKDNAKWLKFTYYPLDIIINKDAEYVNGNNILLGNSASSSNNHLEAFEILSKINIGNRKIITPLSYGYIEYQQDIKSRGEVLFKDKFVGLTDFMPLKDYQNLTQSCGIVIMNHYRQQAVGNVLDMMFRGAKVFLTKKNTLYHYLKRIGCSVFDIDTDTIDEDSLQLLTMDEMTNNRNILYNEVSLDNIVKHLRDTIKIEN